jgi:uncharacterized protein (TIGR02246 family)
MRQALALPILGLGLLACSPAQPTVDLAEARASLQAASQAYHDGIAAKDADALMRYYAADAVAYPPEQPTLNGADAIRGLADALIADPAFAATWDVRPVEVAGSGDVGYSTAMGSLTYTGPDGTPVTEQMRDVHVWRREADGSWKITIDVWNSPAAPTAAQ